MMSTTTTTPTDPAEGTNPGTAGFDHYLAEEGLNADGTPVVERQQDEEEGAGRGRSNAEAARRRVELREAQAERDTLRQQVEGLRRAEVERLASSQLAQPGDLFTVAQVQLADLLDDEGRVDPEAVEKAVTGLLATRPGLRLTSPRPGGGVPSHGLGYRRPIAPGAPTWSDVVAGSRD